MSVGDFFCLKESELTNRKYGLIVIHFIAAVVPVDKLLTST